MIGIPITNRRFFPQFLRKFKQVKGICLGECIDGFRVDEECIHDSHHEDSWEIVAHSHSELDDNYRGWICIANQALLYGDTQTMLHEVAHLLTPGCGHNKHWRAALVSIGGSYRAHSFLNFTYPDYTHSCPIRKKR